jgi:hypothetical protein
VSPFLLSDDTSSCHAGGYQVQKIHSHGQEQMIKTANRTIKRSGQQQQKCVQKKTSLHAGKPSLKIYNGYKLIGE